MDKATLEALYVNAEKSKNCPYCKAAAGEQCRSRGGRWRRNPHKARVTAVITDN